MRPAPSPTAAPRGLAVALLRHDVPGESWHFDWLIAERSPAGPDDRCARGWRMRERPDQMVRGARALVEPLPPHRALYLALPGPVELSDGRGVVTPIAAGTLMRGANTADAGAFVVHWCAGVAGAYRATHGPEGVCIECLRMEAAP